MMMFLHSCVMMVIIISPASTKLKGGYTGFTLSVCPSVRLSVCGQNRVIGSILCLHILSSNFRRCILCNVCSKFQQLKFWRILWICYFDFVFFWLGIQYDSIVWVIMKRTGGILRTRHSSCFNYNCNHGNNLLLLVSYFSSISLCNCSTISCCVIMVIYNFNHGNKFI